jgi:surfeit locus 1 family protein
MSGVARRLLVPALSTIVMLIILIGLGVWQLKRLAWKEGILAQIAQAEMHLAVPLDTASPAPFEKVRATGVFRDDLSALYGAEVRDIRGGVVLGAELLVPMIRQGKPPLLVDRGWVPMNPRQPIASSMGAVSVDGYVHAGDHAGLFSAKDDTTLRRFYTLDPAVIGAAVGLPDIEPYTLVELGPTPPDGYPDPAKHLPRPPNDHLQYAITWFGLAVTLLVIFVVYARKVIRP